jgi:hypothetical protein
MKLTCVTAAAACIAIDYLMLQFFITCALRNPDELPVSHEAGQTTLQSVVCCL